ncbi:uncharacterized protein LOC112566166 [Pomacea canaliculata]|uniref:uncharacterized protein LOC112566166 n=1 Tax=Pomacea canaliculata TaxID=400727 RepID=UPI000D72C346|nr:uncharacterized protein LOC112566166 [Pomacea canaliculata]
MNRSVSTSAHTESLVSFDNLVDDYISRENREIIETIFYGGLTTLLCLIGIPANLLNILVFWHQGLRDRMNVCLFSLSCVDCCYLLCAFAIFSVPTFTRLYDQTKGDEIYIKVFTVLGWALYGSLNLSGCLGVVIALDRCACVVFPLHAATLMTSRTMCLIIFTCFLLIQGSHLLYLFSYEAGSVTIGESVRWVFVNTEFYRSNEEIINSFFFTFLGTALPVTMFISVSVATGVTVIKLKAAIAWREKSSSVPTDSSNNNQQMALTSMLIIVSCVYVITCAPFVMRQLSILFLSDCYGPRHCIELFSALTAVVYGILPINSAIYFFIYYRRSTRFRQVLCKLIDRNGQQQNTNINNSCSETKVYSQI